MNPIRKKSVSFLPSQIGDTLQTPQSYTANPLKLLLYDIHLCMWAKIGFLAGILKPIRYGKEADKFDELYPSLLNIKSVVIHTILFVAQSIFLASVPIAVLSQIPAFWIIVYFVIFFSFNSVLCRILNGSKLVYQSDEKLVKATHPSEYWIFLNGVSVGYVNSAPESSGANFSAAKIGFSQTSTDCPSPLVEGLLAFTILRLASCSISSSVSSSATLPIPRRMFAQHMFPSKRRFTTRKSRKWCSFSTPKAASKVD